MKVFKNQLSKLFIMTILITSSIKIVHAQKGLSIDSVFTLSGKLRTKAQKFYTDTVKYKVPNNKTWKIEHVGFYAESNDPKISLEINGTTVQSFRASPASNQNDKQYESAFWLGPGDELNVYVLSGRVGDQSNYLISVIEFALE